MTIYKGEATDPLSPERYHHRTVTGEASGRSTVKIEENGGYVEFTVPEWFEGKTDRTAITVRHSITDYVDEKGNSVGQDGKMKVSINGQQVNILDSFNNFKEQDTLTISSKYTRGYSNKGGSSNGYVYVEDGDSAFWYNDTFGIIQGDLKPGDVIRLEPEINDAVTYCYIDCIDLEVIEEPKEKPENFISITECGAVANDGLDDGPALRAAVDMVNEDPYTYAGVWIPDGTFDIDVYKRQAFIV